MLDTFTNTVLFSMLVLTALAIVRMERLFAVVMLSSVFSLLSVTEAACNLDQKSGNLREPRAPIITIMLPNKIKAQEIN